MSDLSTLQADLQQFNLVKTINDESNESGAFLFISFDLVNSTAFKTLYPNNWPVIFHRFYELVESHVLKNFFNSKVWRYAGDEILFYKQIKNPSELYDAPQLALKIINLVNDALSKNYAETNNILYVKSTLWIAEATFVKSQDIENVFKVSQFSKSTSGKDNSNNRNNLIINFEINGKRNIDFLGSDIDLGFRIAKFAQRNKVVISAELAYILYKEREAIEEMPNGYDVTNCLRIVSYEKLKGIWNNRHYPIVWYHDSWNDMEKMFLYDEHFNSEIVNKLINQPFSKNMKIKRLKKVFTEVDNIEKMNSLIKCFSNEKGEINVLPSTSQYNLTEVHCVAVCFDENGNILLGKRPSDKRRFPGIWEFGCGQLKKFQSFEKCLKESYKEDFAADLDFFDKLTPVSTYLVNDINEGRSIPGIIFIARILNATEVESNYSQVAHPEVKWFNPEEDLTTCVEDEYVKDFKDTVDKAVKAFKEKTN
ncbi:NUDIX hydrolase [Bacillus pseudomycoides]|uniref:NUDIX hydrolase n=1 Tax=Bacillus pseudomycoides TaxID=64104 RepID=UPI000BF37D24|nr:NUDIX hydrolase [Bacillus pseudomycoides]PEP56249.1 hypothetical protein CN564_18100 [Bacillus pseudomycoides]